MRRSDRLLRLKPLDSSASRHKRVLAQVESKRLKEAQVWKRCFGTEDGKQCLALLKEHYYDVPMIAEADPTVTQNRAAQRDLVRYIIEQLETE